MFINMFKTSNIRHCFSFSYISYPAYVTFFCRLFDAIAWSLYKFLLRDKQIQKIVTKRMRQKRDRGYTFFLV